MMEVLREMVDECSGCHDVRIESTAWSTEQLRKGTEWGRKLQSDFLDCEANVLHHLDSRKIGPMSISQSSRNSSRMATVRRMEAERVETELHIRAEAEGRELNIPAAQVRHSKTGREN